jgi:hypothetical protein
VREPDRVRDFLRANRPSKLSAIAVARQRSGTLTFVVASIGIVAWQWSGRRIRSAPESCALTFDGSSAQKDRPDVHAGRSKIKGLNAPDRYWQICTVRQR